MFSKLGANAILAVSLAVCKAGAAVLNIPLYKVYILHYNIFINHRLSFFFEVVVNNDSPASVGWGPLRLDPSCG